MFLRVNGYFLKVFIKWIPAKFLFVGHGSLGMEDGHSWYMVALSW